jgi:hypothetical protein
VPESVPATFTVTGSETSGEVPATFRVEPGGKGREVTISIKL